MDGNTHNKKEFNKVLSYTKLRLCSFNKLQKHNATIVRFDTLLNGTDIVFVYHPNQ